ncbi:MAG: hypothetical protein RMJ15_03455 [Nitrososphaerota archaeon]|nr:hypothetical protein [Nitrososphaerota archaeon]
MGVRFNTSPPIHLNPVYYYRLKDGSLKAYWKAEVHEGGRKTYLRYVPQRDAEALMSGRLDPAAYFGVQPAKPWRKTLSYTSIIQADYDGSKHGEPGVRYKLVLKVVVFNKRGRVYVYAKKVAAVHDGLKFPFRDGKLEYLGRCDEAWYSFRNAEPLLKARGYTFECFYAYPKKRRGRPRVQPEAREEGVEDWGFEAKTGKYETWGEEARLDEAETWGEESELADRELWGEEADIE